jgi:amidohydrolase
MLFIIVTVCVLALSVNAQQLSLDAMIERDIQSWLVTYRNLHTAPELSHREEKTSAFVAAELRKLGFTVTERIGKFQNTQWTGYGLVGVLKNGPGPTVLVRTELDALPVEEKTGLPYASQVKTKNDAGVEVGVMHACGHDTHVAMLLGAAEVLAGMRDKIKGTVVLIFQPAEEGPPAGEEGGAALMVKEGVMDNPKIEAIFGIHINAATEIGKIKYRPGATMAASDWFTIKVKGKQAHGSAPWTGIDPIAVATQIYTGLQMIVARQSELTKAPVVITVGRINGGIRENIIPEEMTMSGTIRTLDAVMHKEVHEKIRQTATKIAESMGATVDVSITNMAPLTYNTPELVSRMLPSLEKAAGKGNVI